MEIRGPQINTRSDIWRYEADIYNSTNQHVYFELLQKYAPSNSDSAPFLALSLMPAMMLGANIKVDGDLSEKFLNNVDAIQEKLLSWNQGFQKITVQSGVSMNTSSDLARGVGVFFSGGVDSFYSLIEARAQSEEKLTHLILVHGFDIDYQDDFTFEAVHSAIRKVADAEEIELIVVKTNLRDFTDPILDWGFAHGGALGAIALLLHSKLHTIYIPSSYDYDALHPWGSHPDIDPLWAVEGMKIIHHGTEISRVKKTVDYIAQSETALKYLRVCWKNERGRYNCGTCPKCIRTMIDLRIAGVLSKTAVFEKKLTPDLIKKADARGYGSRIFYEQSLAELRVRNNDPELEEAIVFLLEKKYDNPIQKIRDYVGALDGKYNRHRLYKFLSRHGVI